MNVGSLARLTLGLGLVATLLGLLAAFHGHDGGVAIAGAIVLGAGLIAMAILETRKDR